MGTPGAFLVVEDEPLAAQLLQRVLAPHRPTHIAHSLAEAMPFLERLAELRAIVIDVGLGDGSGLTFLKAVRERDDKILVSMLSAHRERDFINEAYRLGASYWIKPFDLASLEVFIVRATTPEPPQSGIDGDRVRTLVEALDLPLQQERVLDLSLADFAPKDIARLIGISESAVRRHIRRILARTGHRRMRELRCELRRGGSIAL